jgi:hypothetical protein
MAPEAGKDKIIKVLWFFLLRKNCFFKKKQQKIFINLSLFWL